MKKLILLLPVFLLSGLLNAQEVISGLRNNPSIITRLYTEFTDAPSGRFDTSYVVLPFYDDFSVNSVWPDKGKWADNTAFINTDFALNPPTIGVATLDAVNEYGELYNGSGFYSFDADTLTSQPIRLDSVFYSGNKAVRKSDSVYFSFYYQPQGRGFMPAITDSLILEFHSPIEIDTVYGVTDTTINPRWRHIWAVPGGVEVDSFAKVNKGRWFRQVLIPISDSALYYKKGFRFRFRNIASLATSSQPDWQSNCDQWNIDLVKIDIHRNMNDTTIEDIAFAEKAPSLLQNYYAMPYHQYTKRYIDEMKSDYELKIANLDRYPQNLQYDMNVRKDSNEPYYTYSGESYSILPFLTNGYLDWPAITNPEVKFFYGLGAPSSVVFHSMHYITTDEQMKYRQNDTIWFTQVFSNYYAYDDGTAEAGVGLNGAAGSYAVKFKLNMADTIYGVHIYFNQTSNTTDDEYININVWNDNKGAPGNVIAELINVTPEYSGNLNQFATYRFSEPLLLNSSTTPGLIFYVGWSQTSHNNLNVGLDRFTDSHDKRFYNVSGFWQQSDSLHAGSLLLRPIVGLSNPLSLPEEADRETFSVAPNPVTNGAVRITLPDSWKEYNESVISVDLFDTSGKAVLNTRFAEKLDLPSGMHGLYLLKISNTLTGKVLTGKILIL